MQFNNGSLTQEVSSLNGTTNYGYDLENRLVSAVTPSSSAYYGYSGDGRRTYSYIDNNEVEYIYDGLTPLIERSGPGTYIAAYTKLPSAPGGIGGLISSHDGTNTLYYHDSNLGNVNQVTNSAGVVIQTYDYDAFGNITAQTGALTAKYAYKTKEYSPETGLVFFGRRYYNPLVGRFITKDPLGQIDGPNVYIYCNNDPVNKYDPWGLEGCDPEEKAKEEAQDITEVQLKKIVEVLKSGNQQEIDRLVVSLGIKIHPDTGKMGEQLIHIQKGKEWNFRFNKAGELVEHSGKSIGKAAGPAKKHWNI